MYPIKEIGKKTESMANGGHLRIGLFFRFCRINLLALACFPLFVHATLSTQLKEVKGAAETAKVSGLKNSTLSNADLSIGSGFEQNGSSSTLFESVNKRGVENNTMRGLLLNDQVDDNLQKNITQAQTAVSSKNSTATSEISENETAPMKAEGSITEKIRSLAIMLSVVALPPTLVVGLLLFKVRRRNKKYAHRHVPHQHSWQS